MRASTACIPSVRLCVREDGCSCTFPLTGGLPSIPSAPFGLFGDFSGTIPPSDCPCPSIIGLRPWTSQCSPGCLLPFPPGGHGLSQFLCKVLQRMYRAFDCAEILPISLVDRQNIAFRRY